MPENADSWDLNSAIRARDPGRLRLAIHTNDMPQRTDENNSLFENRF
jgi:hypothetical protein